jgi:hypothetical protein
MFLEFLQVLLADLKSVFLFIETFDHLLADCALMVTENGDLSVGFFVLLSLLLH